MSSARKFVSSPAPLRALENTTPQSMSDNTQFPLTWTRRPKPQRFLTSDTKTATLPVIRNRNRNASCHLTPTPRAQSDREIPHPSYTLDSRRHTPTRNPDAHNPKGSALGARKHLIRTSIYDKHSGSIKITAHLDHISHYKTSSGTDRSDG